MYYGTFKIYNCNYHWNSFCYPPLWTKGNFQTTPLGGGRLAIVPDVTAADRFITLGYGLIIIINEGEYMVLSVYKINI